MIHEADSFSCKQPARKVFKNQPRVGGVAGIYSVLMSQIDAELWRQCTEKNYREPDIKYKHVAGAIFPKQSSV